MKEQINSTMKHTNELSKESSPYLLQHQHNPVNWVPWSDDVFIQAKKEDKLVLISVGYSACHWCHVMEKESFENEEVAQIMNDYYICVKVDREERPDVDQVYMNAVQLMTQRGGWPLNCITLPDGRPVYGGTYFPKDQWMNILKTLEKTYRDDRPKFEEYATRLHEGMVGSELISEPVKDVDFKKDKLEEMMVVWKRSFDKKLGGNNQAPKFPLPNNYEFMMKYAHLFEDDEVGNHVNNSLLQMSRGGIYDQIGGGFARYSTDMYWKVPHFEKMLYDNGQMMSVLSQAYSWTNNNEFKQVVYQIDEWLKREMSLPNGAFYSALDADSEGEEGKFYIWKKSELKDILNDDEFEIVKKVYQVNNNGYWEHENYILLRDQSFKESGVEFHLNEEDFINELNRINAKLLKVRDKRIHPGLDDKSLTSWNALMLSGYADAYKAFGDKNFLKRAEKCGLWLESQQTKKDGKLWHTYKNGESKIDGFLEDYALVIEAYLKLYAISLDEKWLNHAESLATLTIHEFEDKNSGMFWFTNQDSQLITRKMELSDNVIPASNSIMARNLYTLFQLTDNKEFEAKARQMLKNMYDGMHTYGSGYSNWAQLLIGLVDVKKEIVVVGPNAKQIIEELNQMYLPTTLIVGSEKKSTRPLFEGRFQEGKTLIYYCENNACQMPVDSLDDLLSLLKK